MTDRDTPDDGTTPSAAEGEVTLPEESDFESIFDRIGGGSDERPARGAD